MPWKVLWDSLGLDELLKELRKVNTRACGAYLGSASDWPNWLWSTFTQDKCLLDRGIMMVQLT